MEYTENRTNIFRKPVFWPCNELIMVYGTYVFLRLVKIKQINFRNIQIIVNSLRYFKTNTPLAILPTGKHEKDKMFHYFFIIMDFKFTKYKFLSLCFFLTNNRKMPSFH